MRDQRETPMSPTDHTPETTPSDAAAVERVCRAIERAERPPALADLAAVARMSESRLQRVFKRVTGLTPHGYSAEVRAGRVREALPVAGSVTDAIHDAGFGSTGRFYEGADAILGMKPADFRAGGAGSRIEFAIGESSLGAVLVARSERGLCAILLGDDPTDIEADLRSRFPRAEIAAAGDGFADLVAQVVAFIEEPRAGLDLPLDIRGTAFQRRVWTALRSIPAGRTLSYAEVAELIGSPKSTRAVAGACAANSLAVAIPCHRVVRADGSLSGYRWGVERKAALLDREKLR